MALLIRCILLLSLLLLGCSPVYAPAPVYRLTPQTMEQCLARSEANTLLRKRCIEQFFRDHT